MKNLVNRLKTLGHRDSDSKEIKIKKSALVGTSSLFGFAGLLWGGTYFLADLYIPGLIPLSYTLLSSISLFFFSVTANYNVFRLSQLLLIMILPFALQISLGTFVPGSAVIIWALMSPLGALVFYPRDRVVIWFIMFGVFLVIALVINSRLPAYIDWNLSQEFITNMFVLNIVGVSSIVFTIQYFFINEQRFLLTFFEQKHQWIKEAFESYISPNLVQYLIQHPEELKLSGEKRECTFVFTDLAGFTRLVEQSDPPEIVSCLNEYIDGMTKIVFEHEGTIQKIVGDAIAVMFSAPVIQEDHAARAVACALVMDEYATAFANQKQKLGIDFGRTRIGVNTGTVIVGNFGSERQLDYRAFGDAINTTARLESVNKYFGTNICISSSTMEKCPHIAARPIGSLVLAGKSKYVETFEPLSNHQGTTRNSKLYGKAFQLIEKNISKATHAFEKLVASYPEDPLASYYLNRLKAGKKGTIIVLPNK